MSNILKINLGTLLLTTALTTPFLAVAQEAVVPAQDEIIVTGQFIPDEKRATSEISSVLNEEVFATTGASDIAAALTRVTGLSLSQGKFVIVRGLNERYSYATLNGSPLPSPEPLRRVAPLDLFPTSLLSEVVVQKTYSPEYSGEFGGGLIDMRTRKMPNDSFLELSISGSVNSVTTAQDGLVYGGSDSDWFGFDDGLRDLPPLGADGNIAQGSNFENFNTLIIDRQDNMPGNIGARITGGHRIDLDSGPSIGILATLGYDNGWTTREGISNSTGIDAGVLVYQDNLRKMSTENKISLNGMLGIGVEFNEAHTIQFTGLATRQSSAEARTVIGVDTEERIIRQDYTEWFEREVYMGQLLGTHYFSGLNDLQLTWRASYAQAGRDAPYQRRVNYEDYEDGLGYRFQFNRPGSNNSISFAELDDETMDFGADFVLPITFANVSADLKFGGAYLDKKRDSEQADFRYFGTLPAELRQSRIDLIFSDPVVNAGILEIRRGGTTGFPDVSSAGLEVIGAYIGADIEVNKKIRLAIGLRYEDSEQTTSIAQSTVANSLYNFEALSENFLLPAATLTYTFADNLQLRLAASKTINRPQFRELTPSIFVNTETDDSFVGNPFLKNSESTNLDARVEWYFGAKQFITLGGFYKDMTNPIEEFVFNGLGDSNATSFINAPSAELYGVEVEFERKWPMQDIGAYIPMLSSDVFASTNFVIRSNYTYSTSSVSADGEVPITPPSVNPANGVTPILLSAAGLYSDGRALQGQSDHLVNFQIGVEDIERNYEATFLVNYSSERIRAVEDRANGLPSILEKLPVLFDFVFNKGFVINGGEYTFGFKIQNILDEGYEASQSLDDVTLVVDSYDIGRTVSFKLKRKF
ncbi:MAG: TonB-dependent receptor [Robiginitomaculum sp.]|nr:MAG: TonB-dependent receptor [Robiginitomaculum sp.]